MTSTASSPSFVLPSVVPDDAHTDLHAAMEWIAAHWPRGAPLSWQDQLDDMPWPVPVELRALGFERWASGAERLVLCHRSGWCLKVPMGHDGVLANREELTMLGRMREEDRTLFAETYALEHDILLQRTYVVDAERFLEYERTNRDILRAQIRLRLTDMNPINVGWREDGSWVFLDWAGRTHPNAFWHLNLVDLRGP